MALKEEFYDRCQRLQDDIEKVLGFRPTVFNGKDAVEVAAGLISRSSSSGKPTVFDKLKANDRLDLTVEHVVSEEEKWSSLFDERLRDAAAARLFNTRAELAVQDVMACLERIAREDGDRNVNGIERAGYVYAITLILAAVVNEMYARDATVAERIGRVMQEKDRYRMSSPMFKGAKDRVLRLFQGLLSC